MPHVEAQFERRPNGVRRKCWLATLAAAFTVCLGCGDGAELAPVTGRVLYNEQPLAFGSIMLQPPAGEPARGTIKTDGTFELETPDHGKGATPGRNKIRITCFEAQRPGAAQNVKGELALGKSLIPPRYANYSTSGLEVDVLPSGNEPLELRLSD